MVIVPITDILHAWKLRRVAKRIQASMKPSIRLLAGDETDDACHRIGGKPNLPRSLEWPKYKDKPLAFLAQFDLATLPALPGSELPRSGSLFFFHMAGNDRSWGGHPDDRGSAQVLYSEKPLANSKPRPMPRALEKERRYLGLALQIETIEGTLPDSDDEVVKTWELRQPEWERYHAMTRDIWNKRDLGNRFGGYPDELQHGVRMEAQLVSNGSPKYRSRKAKQLRPGAADWELLFQLDSVDRAGMMWGDSGLIYFLIRRDDLRERRFERVWAVMQSC